MTIVAHGAFASPRQDLSNFERSGSLQRRGERYRTDRRKYAAPGYFTPFGECISNGFHRHRLRRCFNGSLRP